MRFSQFLACLVGISLLPVAHAVTATTGVEQQVMTTLHMLDYVGVDYPEFVQDGQIRDAAEYQEQVEFAGRIVETLEALPAEEGQTALVHQAKLLQAAIYAKASGKQVASMTAGLSGRLLSVYPVTVAPRQAPRLAKVELLYGEHCAGCHGRTGHGDGPLVTASMEPPPANFHDLDRQRQRSLFGLYNVITLGVKGTTMPGFAQLTEDQRWALAFHVGQHAYSDAQRRAGKSQWKSRSAAAKSIPDLKTLSQLTPAAFIAAHGKSAESLMAYLRAKPGVVAQAFNPLRHSRTLLTGSVTAYRKGNPELAMQRALSAYLEGFELVEPALSSVDSKLMRKIENGMLRFREQLQSQAPADDIAAQADELRSLLQQAETKLDGGRMSAGSSFVGSFVILIREGLEAILVLAAMFAFLRKAERPEGLPWVHGGWIAALLLGIGTWFAATYLIDISGASREKTEGITALLAAVILLSVGLWLHNKSYSSRWQQYVSQKMQGALSGGRLWGLSLLAFVAVYREVFETVLFYRTLWAQGHHGAILLGFVIAAVMLLGVAWAIFRMSLRLPIRQFFSWSSAFIVVLAVVFTGKGVAALQEAGAIPIHGIDFVSIPMLGVYPTAQVLLMQLGVLALVLGGFAWNHLSARDAINTRRA